MNQAAETPLPILRFLSRIAGWCGLGLIAVAVALCDFLAREPAGRLGAGSMLAAPCDAHPFGTDVLGRDMLSETLHGLSLTVGHAFLAAVIAILLGGLFGTVAARSPRYIAPVLRSLMGVFAAVPALLLTLLIIGLTDRSLAPLAAGLAAAPLAFVRAFDAVDLDCLQAGYARATGIPAMTLLRRDLTYEFRESAAAIAARALAAVTIILSTASFLGFGAARDLGLMIAAAKSTYYAAWWTAAFPALALLVLILCARLAAGLEEGERP